MTEHSARRKINPIPLGGWEEGKKFERKKVRIAEKVELFPLKLFSSKFVLVHMEAEVLQQWQTTHFKASSK